MGTVPTSPTHEPPPAHKPEPPSAVRVSFVVAAALLLVAVGIGLWLRWDHAAPDSAQQRAPGTTIPSPTASVQPASGYQSARADLSEASAADYPLAAALNAPDSTIARDLDALQQIFDAWRTNFAREGNPVGENADITAALTGENRLGLVLIPRRHRAINAQGELCDRWGTPFRFHQLSGEKMEIRSAGPDRKFATADDAVWTPQ